MSSPGDDQARRVAACSTLAVAVMLAGLAVQLARVVQLKVAPPARLLEAAAAPVSTRTEPARRGDLLDARGRVLATSTVGYRLFVDPAEVEDPRTIAVDLAAVTGEPPDAIDRAILERASPRYAVIDNLLDDRQVDAVRRAKLRGVGLEPRLVRHRPHPEAAAVVGLVGFEHTGLSGVEYLLEDRLAPQPGRLAYLRDARRRALWVESRDYQPAADGGDVRLAIDLVVQQLARRRLAEAVERYRAGGGRLVVLDPRTGGIIAMCDVQRGGAEAGGGALARNRCVTDPYEPGSTLKPFVWAAATRLGLARPDEIIDTPTDRPHRTSFGRLIRDSHYHGPVSWERVLVLSLNSGMAIVAERLSHEQMQDAISRFGFGRETHCGAPGESAGIVTPPERWTDYTQTSVAFGHEIAVTPVQMARAFAAFARDGTLPQISIIEPADDEYRFRSEACSPELAALVRRVLCDVMTEGTGQAARSSRYRLFGKSGTAQLPSPDGGYFEDRYVSSFIAGAPYEDPRVVVLCVIDDPDRAAGHWGGSVAGPVVRDVIEATLAYLGE